MSSAGGAAIQERRVPQRRCGIPVSSARGAAVFISVSQHTGEGEMKDTPCLPLTGVAIRTAAVKQTAGTTRVGLQPIEHGPSLPLITVAIRTAVIKRTAGASRVDSASDCTLRALLKKDGWWVPGPRGPDDACVLALLFACCTYAGHRVPARRLLCEVSRCCFIFGSELY